MADLTPNAIRDDLHNLPGDEAVVLAKLKSHVTRLLAVQVIADPDFPNRRLVPKPLPPPFCNFGHQLMVDYERLLRIVWKVTLEVRAAVIGKRLRRWSIKWIPPIAAFWALVGLVIMFEYFNSWGITPVFVALVSVGGVRLAKKSERRDVARVRARAILKLLKDRFEDGLDALYVEQHHQGDGALDGPDIPVLTILMDRSPFPGFGSLRANKLLVCPPKTEGPSLAIVDLARTIRNQVAAKATEQIDIVVRQGEVIAVHGAKLSMDSAWLGSDKAPLLWFPRAGLPRVQDVDPRAPVRVFHATQLIFSRYAAAATIFFRVFRTGDSIGLEISMTTLGPLSKDIAELETRLSRHKLAEHKRPRRRKSSLKQFDEGGFDISRYRDLVTARPVNVRSEPKAAHVIDLGAIRTERSVVHALVLAANPPETVRLRIDKEIRSIDEAIRRGRYRDRFELIAQLAVRKDDLQGHLLRYQPEILHFAGHGEAGGLILEDGQGGARRLETEDLRVLIALLGRRIRCVVLNACLTHSQAELLAQHVPAVVGMSRTIDDPLAIEFAAGFYEALAYGENVKSAFELGSQRFAHGRRGAARDIMATIDAAPPANAPVLLGNTDPGEIRFF